MPETAERCPDCGAIGMDYCERVTCSWDQSRTTALAIPAKPPGPLSRDIIKEIAMDIGKEVAAHIETMYPDAVKAASSTFLLSVRNCVHNEIMASLETIDEKAIRARLEQRKHFRRRHRSVYRKLRDQPITEDVITDG